MVNLLTGQKGSGKTQQMIEAANKKAKECDGNVIFIKNSHFIITGCSSFNKPIDIKEPTSN